VPVCLLRVEAGKDTLHALRTALALEVSAQRRDYKSEALEVSQRLIRTLHTHTHTHIYIYIYIYIYICNMYLCVHKHNSIMMYGGVEA